MAVSVRIDYKDARTVLGGPSGPLYAAVRNQAETLRGVADRYTPVDTGRLASSLMVEMSLVRGVPVARVGSSNDVKYAIWVHNGTRRMRRRPFLTRAARELFGPNFRQTSV
jgi:hypothetical protein